jgi:hypothetical protein
MSALPKDDKMFEDSVIANILESIRDMSASLGNLSAKQDNIDKNLDGMKSDIEQNTKDISSVNFKVDKIPTVASVIKWGAGAWVTSIGFVTVGMWSLIKFLAVNFPQLLH